MHRNRTQNYDIVKINQLVTNTCHMITMTKCMLLLMIVRKLRVPVLYSYVFLFKKTTPALTTAGHIVLFYVLFSDLLMVSIILLIC